MTEPPINVRKNMKKHSFTYAYAWYQDKSYGIIQLKQTFYNILQ